jgi:hypothetical protein
MRGFVLLCFCFRNFLVTTFELLHQLELLVLTKIGLGKKGNLSTEVIEKWF